jgi:hypothetical protein
MYDEDQVVIMAIYGNQKIIFFNKSRIGYHMLIGVSVPSQHILRAELIDRVISRVIACVPSEYKKKRVQVKRLQSNKGKHFDCKQAKMVGERIRKEPIGEVENWKNKEKVWK